MQCSVPPEIRQQLLFCRVQCINAVNKKFLIKELRRAADGELREHAGRQQVFTDLSKAFTELSFILVEMENKEASQLMESDFFLDDDEENEDEDEGRRDEVGGDVDARDVNVTDISLSLSSDSDEDDLEDTEADGGARKVTRDNRPSPLKSSSGVRTWAGGKRGSISSTMAEFRNSTSDLVKAGVYILYIHIIYLVSLRLTHCLRLLWLQVTGSCAWR
jgi:hypothetical protein